MMILESGIPTVLEAINLSKHYFGAVCVSFCSVALAASSFAAPNAAAKSAMAVTSSVMIAIIVDEFIGQEFDTVITVCDNAKETCPVFPGKTKRVHQTFEDPPPPGVGSDEERLSIFRRVRDEICAWMKDFITEQNARNDWKSFL